MWLMEQFFLQLQQAYLHPTKKAYLQVKYSHPNDNIDIALQ